MLEFRLPGMSAEDSDFVEVVMLEAEAALKRHQLRKPGNKALQRQIGRISHGVKHMQTMLNPQVCQNLEEQRISLSALLNAAKAAFDELYKIREKSYHDLPEQDFQTYKELKDVINILQDTCHGTANTASKA